MGGVDETVVPLVLLLVETEVDVGVVLVDVSDEVDLVVLVDVPLVDVDGVEGMMYGVFVVVEIELVVLLVDVLETEVDVGVDLVEVDGEVVVVWLVGVVE